MAAASLIGLNAALSLWLRLGLERKLLVAALRTVVQLTLLGYLLVPVFAMQQPAVVFGMLAVMVALAGREAVKINPDDAGLRGIHDGDVVRLFNDRGACLAGARVTASVMAGAVVLATGAWYDPETGGGLDRHGNPNVLTLDKGTSRLAQGSSAHTTLVDIEKFAGPAPKVEAFDPPEIVSR